MLLEKTYCAAETKFLLKKVTPIVQRNFFSRGHFFPFPSRRNAQRANGGPRVIRCKHGPNVFTLLGPLSSLAVVVQVVIIERERERRVQKRKKKKEKNSFRSRPYDFGS